MSSRLLNRRGEPARVVRAAIVFAATLAPFACAHMSDPCATHPLKRRPSPDGTLVLATYDRECRESAWTVAALERSDSQVEFRNEQQRSSDPAVIASIRQALADVATCIDGYYKTETRPSEAVSNVTRLIDNGEHRSSVEMMLGYVAGSACPLSSETYDAVSRLSATFDLKPLYLQRVTPLVRR